MATVKEMMMKDAPASVETSYMISAGDMFEGEITPRGDDDWISIEMSEGKEYTITVGGRATKEDDTATTDVNEATASMLNDSILKLMDGKGGVIDMNDDIDPAKGKLGSQLKFTPEAGSGTQMYFISVSGYSGNPGADNSGGYTLSVTAVDVLPAGEGADIEGTAMDDKLFGTDDSESIAGLAGNDTIDAGGGDDSLSGGDGNDLLIGGPGADTIKGGDGDMDTISYAGSPMGVTINLRDGTARGGHADGDDLGTDIENVMGSMYDDMITGTDDVNVGNSLWGLDGADSLYGREGPDMLYGGAGDDMLDGGDEDDELEGGPGADTLTGGLGADTASYASSMMGVTVRLHTSQAMGGDAEGDIWGDTVTVQYEVPAEDPEDPPVEMEETVPDIVHLKGSAMADILAGDSRDNTIMGMGGDDKLYGGPGGGDDNLQGGGGNDMLFGGRGVDTLSGGPGNDMLNGGAGADKFFGGTGNDMIYADLDDTAIDGGEDEGGMDMDTVSFARLVDKAVGATSNDGSGAFLLGGPNVVYNPDESAYGTFAADGSFVADTTTGGIDAAGIERVIGSDEDDFITGAAASPEEIEGGDGGDMLIGGDGGGDTVSYENSDRRVRVDLGNSNTSGGTAETPSGGHATGDTISGFENIKGSAFGDVLEAIDGTVNTVGSTLWGLGGDDSLVGRAGNDTIEGGAGADELDGGYTAIGGTAGAENDESNTLSYAGSDAGVNVNLGTVSASGGHAEGDDIETYEYNDDMGTTGDNTDDVEVDVATFVNVTGSMHNDRLTGDRFGNTLAGNDGDDNLRGGVGGDTLNGGKGADALDGGQDRGDTQSEDWAVYRGAAAGVTVNLNTGTGTGGEAMGDTLKNIELIWGSKKDDTFIASEGVDIIHGDGGSDTVSYEASKHGVTVRLNDGQRVGTDSNADGSPDTFVFVEATDAIVGQWRGGTFTRPGAVEADDSNATTKSYAEGDILASIENVIGSRQDDVIDGEISETALDDTPNVIKGGAGADRISGGTGNDKLHGGPGNDVIGARAATDLNGDGDVTDPGEAIVSSSDEDGDDMMYGDAGNDTINGGHDNDTINGGTGDDDMTGGDGVDTFVFGPGNGSDVIVNIQVGGNVATADANRSGNGDYIDLTAFGIRPGDVMGLLSERAGNVVVNLEDYGGGRITIQDTTIAALTATDGIELVLNDTNGAMAGIGTEDGATDGIFIV